MTRAAPGLRQRGFTLVELMIVVAVVAIVLVLAAPSFRDMIEGQRLRGTSAQLVTDFQFARTEAASRQEVVGLSFKANAGGKSCYTIHTCGTTAAAICRCDCAAAVGARCVAPRREIRTVEVPTSSRVKVAPVPVGAALATSSNVMFDPATGVATAYFPIVVIGPNPPPAPEFWAEVSLLRPAPAPALRTELSGTGRPRTCSPGGRVTGVTPCS